MWWESVGIMSERLERQLPPALVLAASFALSFLGWGTIYSSAVLLPSLASRFQVGRAEAAISPALLAFLALATGPLAAALLNRLGHSRVTLAGVAIAVSGLVLGGLYTWLAAEDASILPLHLSVGGLGGLGLGLLYLPSLDVLPSHFPHNLGLAMGIACCGSGVTIPKLWKCILVSSTGWSGTALPSSRSGCGPSVP